MFKYISIGKCFFSAKRFIYLIPKAQISFTVIHFQLHILFHYAISTLCEGVGN